MGVYYEKSITQTVWGSICRIVGVIYRLSDYITHTVRGSICRRIRVIHVDKGGLL